VFHATGRAAQGARNGMGGTMRGTLVVLGLLLSGIWVVADAVAKEKKAAPALAATTGKKTVCVVSEATQRFQLKKIGMMVFANEDKTIRITDWKLDERVHAKTKALLGKTFNVKPIPASYEIFQPMHEQGDLFRDRDAEMNGMVQKTLAGASCDFVLVIVCGGSQFSSSNQFLTGLGVLETGTEAFGHNREIYALTAMSVLDGKTLATLKAERGGSDKPMFFEAIRGPSKPVDVKAYPSLQSVADDPKTRDVVWSLMERSLDLTLPQLFEVKGLETAAKETAEAAKTGGAKKENWAPF
jgi:hypothetical protein